MSGRTCRERAHAPRVPLGSHCMLHHMRAQLPSPTAHTYHRARTLGSERARLLLAGASRFGLGRTWPVTKVAMWSPDTSAEAPGAPLPWWLTSLVGSSRCSTPDFTSNSPSRCAEWNRLPHEHTSEQQARTLGGESASAVVGMVGWRRAAHSPRSWHAMPAHRDSRSERPLVTGPTRHSAPACSAQQS